MPKSNQPNNLKLLRKKNKLTQKELAKEIKIPYRTIQRWESGENQIKDEKVKILANYFGVTPAQLLGYEAIDNNDTSLTFDSGAAFDEYRSKLIEKSKYSDTRELSQAFTSNGEISYIKQDVTTSRDKIKQQTLNLIENLNFENTVKWLDYGELLFKVQNDSDK